MPGFLAEHSPELVELVFSTRPGYDDAASQQAVLDVLRAALCDDTFLKAFAGALVRYEGPWASAQVPASLAARRIYIPPVCTGFHLILNGGTCRVGYWLQEAGCLHRKCWVTYVRQ